MAFEVTLHNAYMDEMLGFAYANSRWGYPLVQRDSRRDRSLVICGAGPSLAQIYRFNRSVFASADDVWACNSALDWVTCRGVRATGFAIDQSHRMFEEVWPDPPHTDFVLATTVHPLLVQHLRRKLGKTVPVQFFHSFVGVPGETEVYYEHWGTDWLVGEGLNAVNRALSLGLRMGYEQITLVGTDCAFDVTGAIHANGSKNYGDRAVIQGEVDGRQWVSTVDMLMSAVDLVRRWRKLGNRLRILGDTLPWALRDKDDEYLDEVIRYAKPEEIIQQQIGITGGVVIDVQAPAASE